MSETRNVFSLNNGANPQDRTPQQTLNRSVTVVSQPTTECLPVGKPEGGAGTPLPVSHQNGVVCVMEITHLTPAWWEQVEGGVLA